jgi:ABC-type nitrate/sulfonate/bicarbonate transport system permease component
VVGSAVGGSVVGSAVGSAVGGTVLGSGEGTSDGLNVVGSRVGNDSSTPTTHYIHAPPPLIIAPLCSHFEAFTLNSILIANPIKRLYAGEYDRLIVC